MDASLDSDNVSMEKDGTSSPPKRIHILGAGNLGAFVAHSLAGIPDRPPITLLLRPRQLRYWEESGRSIKITARKITEARKGFDVQIARPMLGRQSSGESKVPMECGASDPSHTPIAKPTSIPSTDEKRPAMGTSRLALNDGNPIFESGPLSRDDEVAINASSAGLEANIAPMKDGQQTRTAEAEGEDSPDQLEKHEQALDIGGKPATEHDDIIYNLIVTVKAPQTIRALQAVAHRLGRSSTILFLQNGMGIIEEVNEKLFPNERDRPTYIIGVVSHGLYSEKIFSVVHAGEGTMALGIMPRMPMSEQPNPENLATMAPSALYLQRTMTRTPVFVAVGFSPTDLLQQQLDKLAANCIINPLTALLGCNNGGLISNYHCTRVIRLLLAEISLVLRKLPELKNVPNVNMRYDTQRLEKLVFNIAKTTAGNQSSMLQDLRAGKETEIDYINGYIIKCGEEMGVYCIMNYMLVHMIKGRRKIVEGQTDFFPVAGIARDK